MIVAATWLCRNGDAVLAVHPIGQDVYFLPGGMPEPHETWAEAACREVAEEIGVAVHPDDLVEVARVRSPAHGRPGEVVLLVCFQGPGVGEPVPDGVEVDEVRWLAPSQWEQFAPAVQQALRRLRPRAGDARG